MQTTSTTPNPNLPDADSLQADSPKSLQENPIDAEPSPGIPTPGFDTQHPPEQKLIDTCVHCGFCLSTCPSYRVIGKEMDSPRGRVYLMNAINNG